MAIEISAEDKFGDVTFTDGDQSIRMDKGGWIFDLPHSMRHFDVMDYVDLLQAAYDYHEDRMDEEAN